MNVLSVVLFAVCLGSFFGLFFFKRIKINRVFNYPQYEFCDSEIENKQGDLCVKILADIIKQKLNNKPNFVGFLKKDIFENLNLNYQPVYKLFAKKINKAHLLLYLKAFELIKKPVNLFLFDYADQHLKLQPPKVKIYYINSNTISYEILAITNALNINYAPQSSLKNFDKQTEFNFNNMEFLSFNEHLFYTKNLQINMFFKNLWHLSVGNASGKVGWVKFENFIDKNRHIVKNYKNIIKICNLFGDCLFEMETDLKPMIVDNVLYFKIKTKAESFIFIKKHFNLFESYLLSYLKFKILPCDRFSKQVNWLFEMAVKRLSRGFELPAQNAQLHTYNSDNYFKVAVLKKDYILRYYTILKNFYGIHLKTDGFVCKPSENINNFMLMHMDKNKNKLIKFERANLKTIIKNLQVIVKTDFEENEKTIYF